jgi:hypothetical protein
MCGGRRPHLLTIGCGVYLAIEMIADESPYQRALLMALLVAIGVESIQLRCAKDDRDLLPVIHQRGSLIAGASVRKSAHFSTLIHHSAYIAAHCALNDFPIQRPNESLGNRVASRPSSSAWGLILYEINIPDRRPSPTRLSQRSWSSDRRLRTYRNTRIVQSKLSIKQRHRNRNYGVAFFSQKAMGPGRAPCERATCMSSLSSCSRNL